VFLGFQDPDPDLLVRGSVADPDSYPDPPDPHVFGPSGSGSISQRYGSGSGSGSRSFQTLIPTFCDFLSWKNYVNVRSKSTGNKKEFFLQN
jgi:hypothetical protein